MSLFVGNISKNVRMADLEDQFMTYGRCEIKQHGSYAFIVFDEEKQAEDAMSNLNGLNMGGLEIGIEWSKRSGRFDASKSRRPPPKRDSETKCYNCNRYGHFARDCRSRRRSRSRSYERDRRRYSKSRSPTPRGDRRRDYRDDRRRSPGRYRDRRGSYDRRDSFDRDRRRYSRSRSPDRRRDMRRRDSPDQWRKDEKRSRSRSFEKDRRRKHDSRGNSPQGSRNHSPKREDEKRRQDDPPQDHNQRTPEDREPIKPNPEGNSAGSPRGEAKDQ